MTTYEEAIRWRQSGREVWIYISPAGDTVAVLVPVATLHAGQPDLDAIEMSDSTTRLTDGHIAALLSAGAEDHRSVG